MARYRIKHFNQCTDYYMVQRRYDGYWVSIASYAHEHWRGEELKRAIKAVRRLIQLDKQNRKRGK